MAVNINGRLLNVKFEKVSFLAINNIMRIVKILIMTKEKQIEKMAVVLTDGGCSDCTDCL